MTPAPFRPGATMRAAAIDGCGGPERIRIAEVPRPVPAAGEVLVRVRACALNHMDLLVLRGPAGPERKFPFWGGADAAGVVAAPGDRDSAFREGDRVAVNPALWCGACEHCIAGQESLCVDFRILGDEVPGGFAEYVCVPARNLLRMPEDFPFEEAAACPLAFQTAWRALLTQARLRPGEDVLVLGASGGVATAAIQIARLAGARVFAVTSGPAKAAAALEIGADFVIDRGRSDFAAETLRLTRSRGVDVVVENVGTPTWKQSLRCLARGGRLVTYGRTAGLAGEINIRELFIRQNHVIGSTMASRREFEDAMRLVFARRLRPVIDRVLPLEECRAAHERLEAGEQFGKIVLRAAP